MTTTVRKARVSEASTLAGVLTRAFYDDPVVEWFMPDNAKREANAYLFFKRLQLEGPAGRLDETYTTDDDGAVAIWAPPDKWKVGVLEQLRVLPIVVRILTPRRLVSRLAGYNKLAVNHPHEPPHWYLQTLGTDPAKQGKGLASALMHDRLAHCDAEGLPAYLESSKESNLAFYGRHGFEVTGTFDLPDGPRLWLMWREPR